LEVLVLVVRTAGATRVALLLQQRRSALRRHRGTDESLNDQNDNWGLKTGREADECANAASPWPDEITKSSCATQVPQWAAPARKRGRAPKPPRKDLSFRCQIGLWHGGSSTREKAENGEAGGRSQYGQDSTGPRQGRRSHARRQTNSIKRGPHG
jgi:hypothetical protein